MKPYHTAPDVTLYNAPALEVARALGDDSVDLIVVFDPMCGGGWSAFASRNLGRVWIGGDLDARWCNATVKRLARSMDDWQPRVEDTEKVELLRRLG